MPNKVAAALSLRDGDRPRLEALIRSNTVAAGVAQRARIVLLAADGLPSRQISKLVGMHESHVAMWRQRFLAGGLAGLRDAPRPGGPRKYDPVDRLRIVVKSDVGSSRGGP